MQKNVVASEGTQLTYNKANTRWLLDIQGYAHSRRMHTPSYPSTYTQARTHARARALTNRDKYVILIAFPLQKLFREHALVLRYTYIAYLV